MAKKLGGGRFRKKIDPDFDKFSASFRWDHRLSGYDLAIDAAHAKALKKCGVLTSSEAKKILAAVASLQKKAAAGTLKLDKSSEDVHSAIQAELKKIAGPAADKIHTGRSRNDLVSQSSRLYVKDHLVRIARLLTVLQKEIVAKAAQSEKVLLPGMTHLQPAQVLSQAHIFLSYVEMLERDRLLAGGALKLADLCVLGSGALAGTTYALDQKLIARELGLSAITRNSYDVAGDRDFVAAALYVTWSIGTHLSRIAEDLMIGQTRGFMTVDMDQAFCTGSSMMPQKKNADFTELVRGAAGVFAGNFTGMAVTLKGLPTSYNRDLQWDKKYLFESVETAEEILTIFIRLMKTLRINAPAAEKFLKDESLYATDLADYLVGRGVPFGTAHEQVGKIVSFSEEKGIAISKIGLDLLKQFAPKLEADVYDLFTPEHSVRMKKTSGSTHPAEIAKQINFWKHKLK